MPTNGHEPSSQTDFFPRQSSLTHPYSTSNGHVFSSRTPALRAASAEPSAVRPDGLGDVRDIVSETTVVHPATPVDEERPAVRGWQDKAVLADGSPASSQPAPVTEVVRSAVANTGGVRSENPDDASERKEHTSIWIKPVVKSAMLRLAKQNGDSFSGACADALEVFARAKIHDQEEALFEPRMRKMMRREIRSSDNRHVPFEIKNTIAAEQTRILITDMYKRMLLKEGLPLKAINKKLDDTYNMARTNVLNTKTPKFQTLVSEYWQATEDQASDRQDPAGGSRTESASTREAGTGNPKT
jgi:hypothetical protein